VFATILSLVDEVKIPLQDSDKAWLHAILALMPQSDSSSTSG